jgi:hypothetical protein
VFIAGIFFLILSMCIFIGFDNIFTAIAYMWEHIHFHISLFVIFKYTFVILTFILGCFFINAYFD